MARSLLLAIVLVAAAGPAAGSETLVFTDDSPAATSGEGSQTGLASAASAMKTDDDLTAAAATAAPPPPPPSDPVLLTDGGYTVTFTRANQHEPIISSHFPAGSDGYSAFNFNLVPAFLKLPNGSDALIVRSVNGTSWDPAKNGTTSTLLNPDKLTLTTYVSSSSDMSSVKVEPIFAESVIMEPVNDSVFPGASKAEACGIQDPRLVYNAVSKHDEC